jgi:hypothetical protein
MKVERIRRRGVQEANAQVGGRPIKGHLQPHRKADKDNTPGGSV